jgi:hypothetical protein
MFPNSINRSVSILASIPASIPNKTISIMTSLDLILSLDNFKSFWYATMQHSSHCSVLKRLTISKYVFTHMFLDNLRLGLSNLVNCIVFDSCCWQIKCLLENNSNALRMSLRFFSTYTCCKRFFLLIGNHSLLKLELDNLLLRSSVYAQAISKNGEVERSSSSSAMLPRRVKFFICAAIIMACAPTLLTNFGCFPCCCYWGWQSCRREI